VGGTPPPPTHTHFAVKEAAFAWFDIRIKIQEPQTQANFGNNLKLTLVPALVLRNYPESVVLESE
jgi:hypothetical protein